MSNFHTFLCLSFLLCHFSINAQDNNAVINGRIVTKEGSRDGILITNITKEKYVFSDKGGYFAIDSDINDTLRFTSPDYIEYTYVVNEFDIKRNPVLFPLEQIYGMNRLDEIVITKIDSRSLGLTDKYTQKYTPAERKLKTAKNGLLDPFVNMLSGRTSVLKKNLAYEREDFKVDKFLNAISTARLEGYYKIPADYTESFVYFAITKKEIKDLLEETPIDTKTLERNITPAVFEFLEMLGNRPN
ncbi:hypothetical protein [Myroides sp. N17-2]|uniref:hypothetical protein n=1 Tax=Myroides sp. N17-2 TaxID=2030799 RepID=UPI000EFD2994|nr:hypothetical protein [Myroides sp. N17-2]